MATLKHLRFDELAAAGQLPSPTGVALAIMRLTQNEGTTIQEIAQVLQTDPALTGRILKIANSAFQGAARPVATVQQAMVRLGIRQVRQLALGFSVLTNSRRGRCKAFDYSGFWSRSLAMAVAAKVVSHEFKSISPDEAFTCGLLSQTGSLGLASIYPEEYSAILATYGEATTAVVVAQEQERFATNRYELGAALLEDWGLPETWVEAVRRFADFERNAQTENTPLHQLTVLLQLADKLAAVCVSNGSDRESAVHEFFAHADRTNISQATLIPLCDQVAGEWRDWGQSLEVATQDLPPFTELAERSRGTDAVSPPGEADHSESSKPIDTIPCRLGNDSVPLQVLVIEQDAEALEYLTQMLRNANHHVVGSRDYQEGLRMILGARPHLVLVDWTMTERCGQDLCRTLRETQASRDIYVLVLLEGENEEQIIRALEAGANDYIRKPVRPEMLSARIRACQRVAQLREELSHEKEELRSALAQLAVANRQLQQAALTDALTGLPNRRYLIDRLNQEWARASRSNRPLACLIIDIDNFKLVNDKHGHDIGDEVLKQTADMLRSTSRRSDDVCRLGGEEFVVICSDTDQSAALVTAERLRKTVEESVINTSGSGQRVTVSIGVAARNPQIEDPDALLKAADAALYDAKRSGRNRVCDWSTSRDRTDPSALRCAV